MLVRITSLLVIFFSLFLVFIIKASPSYALTCNWCEQKEGYTQCIPVSGRCSCQPQGYGQAQLSDDMKTCEYSGTQTCSETSGCPGANQPNPSQCSIRAGESCWDDTECRTNKRTNESDPNCSNYYCVDANGNHFIRRQTIDPGPGTCVQRSSPPPEQPEGGLIKTPPDYEDQPPCLTCPEGTRYDLSKAPPQCSDGFGNKVNETNSEPGCPNNACIQGQGCEPEGHPGSTPEPCKDYDRTGIGCSIIETALGGIRTDVPGFVNRLLSFILGISGGIVLILIISAGYRLMVSSGNPERVQAAREQLTSAIVGLLFIIFSLVILQVITRDIIGIPGFD